MRAAGLRLVPHHRVVDVFCPEHVFRLPEPGHELRVALAPRGARQLLRRVLVFRVAPVVRAQKALVGTLQTDRGRVAGTSDDLGNVDLVAFVPGLLEAQLRWGGRGESEGKVGVRVWKCKIQRSAKERRLS